MDSDRLIFGIARTGTGSIATLELPRTLCVFIFYLFIVASVVTLAVRLFS